MPSWNSSVPEFLDRPGTIEAYRRIAAQAAEHDPRIQRVVLFGSLATGRATIASDADLMIVLSDHPLRAIERIPEYLELFGRGPLGVDVFPYTEAEVARRAAEGHPFQARIEAEGVELFRRSPADAA